MNKKAIKWALVSTLALEAMAALIAFGVPIPPAAVPHVVALLAAIPVFLGVQAEPQ